MNTVSDNTDDFVKKAVKLASVEKPGDDFIPSVMNKIEGLSLKESKVQSTGSIISWKGWVFIGTIVGTIFVLLFLSEPTTFNFSFFDTYVNYINSINISISVSSIFLTGVLVFVFYFLLQISLIVRRVNGPEKSLNH